MGTKGYEKHQKHTYLLHPPDVQLRIRGPSVVINHRQIRKESEE
jgi:hypothetical protein